MKRKGNLSRRGQVRGRKAQIKLSFGMIFSIILIVIFLIFAFYAIKTFFGIQSSAQTGKFVSDLQSDIDRVWRSAQSSDQEEYILPSKIEYVCFVDFSVSKEGEKEDLYSELKMAYYGDENLVFYPVGSAQPESTELKNIDLANIINSANPYCIANIDGRVELTLIKDYGEALVTIR